MPTATAPLGKPSATKPTGFTKPAGLSRQTTIKKDVEEEEETSSLQPVHIGISAVALILAALFMWTVYNGDQTPNRTSEYLFGQPTAEGADVAVDSDEDASEGEEEEEESDEDSEEEDE